MRCSLLLTFTLCVAVASGNSQAHIKREFFTTKFSANDSYGMGGPCGKELQDISVFPGDDEYDKSCAIYNQAYASVKPAFVALPQNVEGVQRCLKCSFENSVPCVVKGGGHSGAGYSTIDKPGFVIFLSKMKDVSINKATALVQAGAKWKDVYNALNDSHLVIAGGGCANVGVAGYTMGGGISVLSRKLGLAVDNVVSMTVVLANGTGTVVADENRNPDLFWALRGGGGGNFGIVTDFTFKLHQEPPNYILGYLEFDPGSRSQQALIKLGEMFSQSLLPKELYLELTISANKELHVKALYQGNLTPIFNILKTALESARSFKFKEYVSFNGIFQKISHTTEISISPAYIDGCFLNKLDENASKTIIPEKTIPDKCTIYINQLGGKISEVPKNATSYYFRDANFYLYFECFYNSKQSKSEAYQFGHDLLRGLEASGHCIGRYVNDINGDLDNWLEEFYGGNLYRLQEVKAKWNPTTSGYFHFPQEIQ